MIFPDLFSSKTTVTNNTPVAAPTAMSAPLPGTAEFRKSAPVAPVGARAVPKAWQPALEQAYKAYPKLPRGILEATLMQESSMGTNPGSYNPKIGESAWLGGMTTGASQALQQKGRPVELNSQAGTINAMAAYMDMRREGVDDKGNKFSYTDPTQLYLNRYKTRAKSALPMSAAAQQAYADYVDFYRSSP